MYFLYSFLFVVVSTKVPIRDVFVALPKEIPSYAINGALNPRLALARGYIYRFFLDVPGQPFTLIDGKGNAYGIGITSAGSKDRGILIWDVDDSATHEELYYLSDNDPNYGGTITIHDNGPRLVVKYGNLDLSHLSTLVVPKTQIFIQLYNQGTEAVILPEHPFIRPDISLIPEGLDKETLTIPPLESITYSIPVPSDEIQTQTLIIHSNDIQFLYKIMIIWDPNMEETDTKNCLWGAWSPCSEQCGIGERSRTGSCGVLRELCNKLPCGVDLKGLMQCNWDTWGNWSECSCQGKQWRMKDCDCPHLFLGEFDFSYCNGIQPQESKTCEKNCCEWISTGKWSECSSCEAGTRELLQTCDCSLSPSLNCNPISPIYENCSKVDCCTWQWSNWSGCGMACGSGRISTRTEICTCGNSNGTCAGAPKNETRECVDGESGIYCPHSATYWITHDNWPIDKNTRLCNYTLIEILEANETNSWHSLAKDYVSLLLSVSAGFPPTKSISEALSKSLYILENHCSEIFNDDEAETQKLHGLIEHYLLDKQGSSFSNPNNQESGSSKKMGDNWLKVILGVVGALLVVCVAVGIWLGINWRKNKSGFQEMEEKEDEDEEGLAKLKGKIEGGRENDEEDVDALQVQDLEGLQL